MEIISSEKAENLLYSRSGKTDEIWEKFLTLKPGEGLIVSKGEYRGRGNVARLVQHRAAKRGIPVQTRVLVDNAGWMLRRPV